MCVSFCLYLCMCPCVRECVRLRASICINRLHGKNLISNPYRNLLCPEASALQASDQLPNRVRNNPCSTPPPVAGGPPRRDAEIESQTPKIESWKGAVNFSGDFLSAGHFRGAGRPLEEKLASLGSFALTHFRRATEAKETRRTGADYGAISGAMF